MSESQLLHKWCEKIGVSIGSKENRKILKYLDELIEWNQRMNLVGEAPKEEILRKHFVDSLAVVPFVPAETDISLRLLDIGTGAGFPGLVIKIMRPDIFAYLLESSKKKCLFLEHITSVLGLDGVEILNGRAESYGHDSDYRQSCDIAVCRAVAHLGVISEYAFPFLKLGGYFIAQKGPRGRNEIHELEKVLEILGGKLENMREFALPGGGERRLIFVFKKEREIPSGYPRAKGIPAKRPLHALGVPRGTLRGK